MTPTSTYIRPIAIQLNKRIHRGRHILLLVFSGRKDWLKIIKTLPDIKYSRTISSWYIPYTKKAYQDFQKLNIKVADIYWDRNLQERNKNNEKWK